MSWERPFSAKRSRWIFFPAGVDGSIFYERGSTSTPSSLLTCRGHTGREVTAPWCRTANTVLSILAVGEFVS